MEKPLIEMYETMLTIRLFEERAIELYKEGLVGGSYHAYIGQEAVAAGVCGALGADDYITTTYRGRGQHLAKGADPMKLFAEILGKAEGYCGGKGGPMHIANPDIGLLGANGIVGGGVPIAAGAALSARMAGLDRVSVAFFGDGAINQGAVYEAANLAALWSLPLLLVCENNEYSEMTPLRDSVKNMNLTDRAIALGIPAVVVDGNDPEAVRDATLEAARRARAGEGPTFIEAKTYRLGGHMYGDPETYRSKEEVAAWRDKDPIITSAAKLLANGAIERELADIRERVAAAVAEAANAALNAAEPSPDVIYSDVV